VLRLKPFIEGNASAHTLFFVQGWPDDASLWDEQVAALKDEYRCVRLDMPNYGAARRVRWGYGTEEIVEALATCVREVSQSAPVTLIAHDWGAYWAYLLHNRHPDRIARLAGLDLAPHYRPTGRAALGIVAYQSWLLTAFAVGGPVGDRMTRALAKLVHAPQQGEALNAWMNYPYRNVWADLISGRARRNLAGYWPRVPLLFVYGQDKAFQFHSQNWLDHVERQAGGKVVALPCGHWVTRDPRFTRELASWLRETQRR
jgi:pimeloyl-ACP methyl ester carboxylesterase